MGSATAAVRRRGRTRRPRVAGPENRRQALRARGARCTRARLQVMSVLADPDGHLGAAEIHRRITASGGSLETSTVYRTLERLTEPDLVHLLPGHGSEGSYGLAGEPHHHAVRTRCGAVEEVAAHRLARAVGVLARDTGFRHDALTLTGLCPQCQGRELDTGTRRPTILVRRRDGESGQRTEQMRSTDTIR
ncbi:Fur family transcriptional regulator [Streptomyces sp. NPDC058290]|uniref:Fur family transcriptional regulator n=1 Tax=Streptomyces sp. NPDC058290 TaxID=3346426 RepID=UPI0036EDCEED